MKEFIPPKPAVTKFNPIDNGIGFAILSGLLSVIFVITCLGYYSIFINIIDFKKIIINILI